MSDYSNEDIEKLEKSLKDYILKFMENTENKMNERIRKNVDRKITKYFLDLQNSNGNGDNMPFNYFQNENSKSIREPSVEKVIKFQTEDMELQGYKFNPKRDYGNVRQSFSKQGWQLNYGQNGHKK